MINELHPDDMHRELDIKSDFNLISKKKDDRFGDLKLYHHKQDETKMISSVKTNPETESEYLERIKMSKERLAMNHPNLLKMINYEAKHPEKRDNKDNFKVKDVYEFPQHTLKDELSVRKSQRNYFSEEFLLALAEDLLNALKFLNFNQKYHGDVRPHLIALADEDNKNRLIDCFSQEDVKTMIKNNLNKREQIYISPSLLQCLDKNEDSYDIAKLDVFSLGLVLLESACLVDIQSFYDFYNHDIQPKVMVGFIQDFLSLYGTSRILTNVVLMMLDIEDSTRKSAKDIYQYLISEKRKVNQRKLLELPLPQEENKNSSPFTQSKNTPNPGTNTIEKDSKKIRIYSSNKNTQPNSNVTTSFQNSNIRQTEIQRSSQNAPNYNIPPSPQNLPPQAQEPYFPKRTSRVSYTKRYDVSNQRSKSTYVYKDSVPQTKVEGNNYENREIRQSGNNQLFVEGKKYGVTIVNDSFVKKYYVK
jgi:hypothetical protein